MTERPVAMKNHCVAGEKKIETNVKRLCAVYSKVKLKI